MSSLADGHTNGSIAVSDGQLFLRTDAHLWCIGKQIPLQRAGHLKLN